MTAIPKDQVLRVLREQGDDCKAELVEQQLPTMIDPERHAEQLRRVGISASEFTVAKVSSSSSTC
jgi:hypothetical protein